MSKSTEHKHASFIPLIGGETLGAIKAHGSLPEYILSYIPFAGHDAHLINYLRTVLKWKGRYIQLDNEESADTKYFFKNIDKFKVDSVSSVCPCAGLSSFSGASAADSSTNDWMYKSAEFVLEKVQPTVYWGENAPRLFSEFGRPVAERLAEIGRRNGYTLNLIATKSYLHGNPQKRPRTFYIFSRGNRAPLLDYYDRELDYTYDDILKMPRSELDPMNVLVSKGAPSTSSGWIAYNMDRMGCKTAMEFYEKSSETNCFIHSTASGIKNQYGDDLNTVADWMDKNGFETEGRRVRKIRGKLVEGKGFWGHGDIMVKGVGPAFILPLLGGLWNPFYDSRITLREGLRIMGMPDDFNISGDEPLRAANHICQNVPVQTARDIAHEVNAIVRGERKLVNANFVRQSNVNKSVVESVDLGKEPNSLESLFV